MSASQCQKAAATLAFEDCVRFHGHACPGLALGYRVAVAAMNWLAAHRSGDEDLVAVVENDACGVDAVQCVCGCTFGKGNLIFHDRGKHVYTFYDRASGKGVRIYAEPPEQVAPAGADPRKARRDWLLTLPDDAWLRMSAPTEPLPDKARIRQSARCVRCGERMMETRLRQLDGQSMCMDCAERHVAAF
jgi:formylmethanofuran dehydrogenase subunit E